MRKSTRAIIILAIFLLAGGIVAAKIWLPMLPVGTRAIFDGARAMADVEFQVSLGARTPGSTAHAQLRQYVLEELETAGWETEVQQAEVLGHTIFNLVGKRANGAGPWIILGAHYDSRLQADRDPDPAKRTQPVPGGNDGASGAAVLLEMARILPDDLPGEIWLVFFDAEDNGNIDNWEWIMGSTAFVEELQGTPDAAIIVDMIGDANLNIYQERNSNPGITAEIWAEAEALGYSDQFIPQPGYSILDDHTPFLRVGIPAVDIIDFDYPYYHTTSDTTDKVSPGSLKAVGDTLNAWMKTRMEE